METSEQYQKLFNLATQMANALEVSLDQGDMGTEGKGYKAATEALQAFINFVEGK